MDKVKIFMVIILDEDAPPSPTPDSEQRPAGEDTEASTQKKPSTMSYEAYKKMTNLLLLHMKQQEQLADMGMHSTISQPDLRFVYLILDSIVLLCACWTKSMHNSEIWGQSNLLKTRLLLSL